MEKTIIDLATLTEEQRGKIIERYNHLMQQYKHWYGNNVALASNVFAGHLEAFEWLFGKSMFEQKGE